MVGVCIYCQRHNNTVTAGLPTNETYAVIGTLFAELECSGDGDGQGGY